MAPYSVRSFSEVEVAAQPPAARAALRDVPLIDS